MIPLIHIGYHKTATSWLQKNLFDIKAHGFEALSIEKTLKNTPKARLKSFADLLWKDEMEQFLGPFNQRHNEIKALIADIEFYPDTTYVVSNERLSGNPHSGGFDSTVNAEKLKTIFPEAKILIVVREQIDMIRSCYYQYIADGGWLSLRDYVTMPYNFVAPSFNPYYFRYVDLIRLYQDKFGANNVLVLPYEMFRQAPHDYISYIYNFVGLSVPPKASMNYDQKVNTKDNHFLFKALRFFNGLTGHSYGFAIAGNRSSPASSIASKAWLHLIGNSPKQKQKLKDSDFKIIRSHINNFYEKSNKELGSLMDIDLKVYGYQTK